MGTKGVKLNQEAVTQAEALVNDLQPIGPVEAQKMFGGYGVFADSIMFALIDSDGVAHLRVGPDTQGRYRSAGSAKHSRMPYWAIPADVRTNPDALVEWATEALTVARAAKK
jgi:DNA transformation protein